jgi:hypothetical protein
MDESGAAKCQGGPTITKWESAEAQGLGRAWPKKHAVLSFWSARLALALFHSGHLDEALEHFEQCTVLTPEYLMAWTT